MILCAKRPVPGAAKTRLEPALGAAGAARLAEAFLVDLLERFGRADFGPGVRRVLCYDPPEAAHDFKRLLDGAGVYARWLLAPQVSGDLGARLQAALRWARAMELEPAVFIGSDCPELPAASVSAALRLAARGQAVLNPAADGGYVLLALPAGAPDAVFENVPWSTARTAELQGQRLREKGLAVVIGAAFDDVDEPGDLVALRERIRRVPGWCPRTERFLAAHLPNAQG